MMEIIDGPNRGVYFGPWDGKSGPNTEEGGPIRGGVLTLKTLSFQVN